MVDEVGQAEINHCGFQVGQAVLQRRAPMQHLGIGSGYDIAGVGVGPDRRRATRDRIAHLAGYREWSQPTHGVGQVAESLAEIECRRVGREAIGANGGRSAAAPFHGQPRQQSQFVRCVLQELVLERGFKILKAADGWSARRPQLRPCGSNRNAEVLGNSFGELSRDVEFLCRRIISVFKDRYRR